MNIDALKAKRIAIWGFGQEGRSVARWLLTRFPGQPLLVLDDRALSGQELAPFGGMLSAQPSADLLSGRVAADLIVKSPGISKYRAEAEAARQQGITLTTATNLWLAAPKSGKVIAVTGSNGKSTTTSLLACALQACGLSTVLGGNIGQPVTDFLLESRDPEAWVVEMSSYQTADLDAWPDLGVLLNLYPDHVQWHGSTERYFADKLNLFNPAGACRPVLNFRDPATRQHAAQVANARYFDCEDGFHVRGDRIFRGDDWVLSAGEIRLPGTHNLVNLCAVLTVLDELGLDVGLALPAIREFQGLPHRLQVLGEVDGVAYVSDSISTTPEATLAALKCFSGRPATLLLGGQDRKQNYRLLAEGIMALGAHAAITMGQTGPEIARQIRAHGAAGGAVLALHEVEGLEQAVALARQITPKGGVVLLSPAAPSFDAFKDYRDRGEQFRAFAGL